MLRHYLSVNFCTNDFKAIEVVSKTSHTVTWFHTISHPVIHCHKLLHTVTHCYSFANPVKPVDNNNPWGPKIVAVGRCSEITYVINVRVGTSKRWSLLTGGCYSEVVVRTGLTLLMPNVTKMSYDLYNCIKYYITGRPVKYFTPFKNCISIWGRRKWCHGLRGLIFVG